MYRIKTWQIVFLIILLTCIVNGIGRIQNNYFEEISSFKTLEELDEETFFIHTASGISFVLFYYEDCRYCERMANCLQELAAMNYPDIHFYQINVGKYPAEYGDYPVSGVPSILIYKDGKEINRLLGVSSLNNLKMILSRTLSI
ncbi:MAG: thioredoxin family protein [Tannerellaceae bacterium]|nr:thioredoxin family protein [Tannerellaceae bacterium]MCD8263828.1 thioredoxin family protein [Tannerellaceae bacterium]